MLEKYKKVILHEFIHYVNQYFCKLNNCNFSCKYLAEGIAQYLSGQNDNKLLKLNYSIDDILNSNNCYNGWYLVTKFIIENYSRDFFLELLKDREKSNRFLKKIFSDIKKYYLET